MTLATPAEQREKTAEEGLRGAERRRCTRFACQGFAEALVFDPEILVRGEIRDISRTGCFVMTRAHLKLERATEIELRFAVNGDRFRMRARVADVRPGRGMGLEFVLGDAKANAALQELIVALGAGEPSSG